MSLAALALAALAQGNATPAPPPSVVLILADDLGYGDLSSAGHPTLRTPRIDRLAAEGLTFTQYYAGASVCTPSRAALLTGCHPRRVGLHERVIFPPDDHGLHPDEVTLAEVLGDAGFATRCVGKWHLGHRPGLLPLDQGFDGWFGLPYSNDMSRVHRRAEDRYGFRLPLIRDESVVEWEPDQRELTRRLTEDAVEFIAASDGAPFFLYVAHPMPHIPLYVSDAFEGTSRRGLYGDVVAEVDWSVGRILDALDEHGRREDTLVLFTSDNGPWTRVGLAGGSAGPLRGGKGMRWEGGHRAPMIARWPGRVPAGARSEEVVTSMDWLPTLAALAGAPFEPAGPIDGRDVGALLGGGALAEPGVVVYYETDGRLGALRRGPWKIVLGHGEAQDELYHLEHDVSERRDVAARHPELAAELRALALERGASLARDARPVGRGATELFDPRMPR